MQKGHRQTLDPHLFSTSSKPSALSRDTLRKVLLLLSTTLAGVHCAPSRCMCTAPTAVQRHDLPRLHSATPKLVLDVGGRAAAARDR